MLKKLLPIFIIIILSLIAIWPLFTPGYFLIHDDQQIVRLYELDKTLKTGVFPVRWVADLGFGYGYPLFNFYPPFVYYFGEIFHLLGFSFLSSIKIVWGVALVGSALSMYFFAKQFFGKIGGIVSAMFYLYVPYHAVDAYVRGALAELFSFIWLPLILLFAAQKKYLLTAICLAGLMLTHNLIFLPFVGFYLLWSRNFRSLILAMGLTAFFWLPSLWEKSYTLTDQFLTGGLAAYKIHFVCPSQLWNSLWGYGGSIAGCVDGLSFKLGKPQIFMVVVAFLIGIVKRSGPLLLATFCFIAAIFITTQYSEFIWNNISWLWYLQFPWRFLEFAALFSAFVAGSYTLLIKKTRWQILVFIGLVFSVIYLHGKYFRPQSLNVNANDANLLTNDEIKWRVSQTSFEYMSKGVAIRPTVQGSYILDIPKYPVNNYSVTGNFIESSSSFKPGHFELTGNFYTASQIQFNTTDFPGWKVWVDNQPTSFQSDNSLKLVTLFISAGNHHISGRFLDTPVRIVGNSISIFAIMWLIYYKFYGRKRYQA